MANRVCWNCGVKSHHTAWGEPYGSLQGRRQFLAFSCDECRVLSLGESIFDSAMAKSQILALMDAQSSDVKWHPAQALGKDFPDVPADIAVAANEAHVCRSVNAYRAAILMARSVVEATAKKKGVTKGTLESKIDEMRDKNLITDLIQQTAHEIRIPGNDMAHGDFERDVSPTEADDVLSFMDEVLEAVYQAPARLNARREERLARVAAAKAQQES